MTPDSSENFLSHLFPAPPQPAMPESAGAAVPVELRPVLQRRVSGGAGPMAEEGRNDSAVLATPPVPEKVHAMLPEREAAPVAQMIEHVLVESERGPKQPHPIKKTERDIGGATPEDVSGEVGEERAASKAAPAPEQPPRKVPEEKRGAARTQAAPETPRPRMPQVPTEPVRARQQEHEINRKLPGALPEREARVPAQATPASAPESERGSRPGAAETRPDLNTGTQTKASVQSPPPREAPPLSHKEIVLSPRAMPVAETIQPAKVEEKSSPVPTIAREEPVAPPAPEPPRLAEALPAISLRPLQRRTAVDSTPPKPGVSTGVTLRIGRVEILARPAPVRRLPRVFRAPRSHQIEPRALTGRRR